jgi:predicted metalloendopeptidase
MQTETQQKFNEKAACFIEQYSQQMINKLGIYSNGLRTLEENLSDNGKLHLKIRVIKTV